MLYQAALDDEDKIEHVAQGLLSLLGDDTRPKAVLLLTELSDEVSCAESAARALQKSAAAARYVVEFCATMSEAYRVTRPDALRERIAASLVPLFVMEGRNRPSLCDPVPMSSPPALPDDALALPTWPESEAAAAHAAAEAAFEAADAGSRLTGLVDVVVHDFLAPLAPTSYGIPRAHDVEATSLARLRGARRFLGPTLKEQANVAARFLRAQDRPLFAVLADEPGAEGLVANAGLLEALLDHCDEIALAGTVALECLAALGISTGKHKIDASILPTAQRLLAKAARQNVQIRLPIDFVTGDLPPDEDSAEGDDDDEGFEYDGDVGEAQGSVPPDVFALDVGPMTCEVLKASVQRARTVVWSGLLGAADCAAFQTATRELTDACFAAREERGLGIVLVGQATSTWVPRFAAVEEDLDVTHVTDDQRFAGLFVGAPFPGLDAVQTREPLPDELLLDAERRARQAELDEEAEEDEEEADDEDDDDA